MAVSFIEKLHKPYFKYEGMKKRIQENGYIEISYDRDNNNKELEDEKE